MYFNEWKVENDNDKSPKWQLPFLKTLEITTLYNRCVSENLCDNPQFRSNFSIDYHDYFRGVVSLIQPGNQLYVFSPPVPTESISTAKQVLMQHSSSKKYVYWHQRNPFCCGCGPCRQPGRMSCQAHLIHVQKASFQGGKLSASVWVGRVQRMLHLLQQFTEFWWGALSLRVLKPENLDRLWNPWRQVGVG